jgi:diketogulonate reductase-like aldo/keto reductase
MVELQQQGRLRSIGVSNFTEAHLREIADATGVMPAVNQVEMHPYFPQVALRANHAELGVVTESWSPLGDPRVFDEPAVIEAARAHGVTPAQTVLRWQTQLGAVPIPKSANRSRQQQNADLFGFELTADELADITALGRPDGRLFGGEPDHHEEM